MQEKPVSMLAGEGKSDWNGSKFLGFRVKGKLVLYKNALFDVTGIYTDDEARVLVVRKCASEKSEIDYIKSRQEGAAKTQEPCREHIPERVRNEVWRRDGGKCVECGSMLRIEFDHIIPISKGGSNTARNLRILCEECNRRKSDRIG
jgi:hypothetical protein